MATTRRQYTGNDRILRWHLRSIKLRILPFNSVIHMTDGHEQRQHNCSLQIDLVIQPYRYTGAQNMFETGLAPIWAVREMMLLCAARLPERVPNGSLQT